MKKKTSKKKDDLVDLEVTLNSDDLRELEKIAQKKGLTASSLAELWLTEKAYSNHI